MIILLVLNEKYKYLNIPLGNKNRWVMLSFNTIYF